MGIIKEFKEFAMRGNVLDMAVGVVVGGAFGKIVTSLVNNIIMPPFGVLLGGIDFSDFFIPLSTEHVESLAEAKAAGIPVIAYGSFLNTVIEFLIIAFAIFMVLKQLNRFLPKPEPLRNRGSARSAASPLRTMQPAARTAPASCLLPKRLIDCRLLDRFFVRSLQFVGARTWRARLRIWRIFLAKWLVNRTCPGVGAPCKGRPVDFSPSCDIIRNIVGIKTN